MWPSQEALKKLMYPTAEISTALPSVLALLTITVSRNKYYK